MTNTATWTPPSCPSAAAAWLPDGKAMCGPCWSEVPEHLRRDVYRTWRAYVRARNQQVPRSERIAALQEYRAARDAAIGSIR